MSDANGPLASPTVVAVKQIWVRDEYDMQLVQYEADALEALQDSPFSVAYHGLHAAPVLRGRTEGHAYVIMG